METMRKCRFCSTTVTVVAIWNCKAALKWRRILGKDIVLGFFNKKKLLWLKHYRYNLLYVWKIYEYMLGTSRVQLLV